MHTIESALESAELLRGLSPAHRKTLAGCAAKVSYEPGEFLARSGDVADAFWLVREGRLALELMVPGRGEITVALVSPGDLVGFSWLCPPHIMQFDVRALTFIEADRFDGRTLRSRCDADAALGFELTSRFAQLAAARVEAMSMQLLDLYGDHPIEQG